MIIVVIMKDFGRSTECLIESLLVAGGEEKRIGLSVEVDLLIF